MNESVLYHCAVTALRLILKMAGYLFAALLVTALLTSYEGAANHPHSTEQSEAVQHRSPPPRSLYRASNSERQSRRARGDTRPNFVIFFPDGKESTFRLWLSLKGKLFGHGIWTPKKTVFISETRMLSHK